MRTYLILFGAVLAFIANGAVASAEDDNVTQSFLSTESPRTMTAIDRDVRAALKAEAVTRRQGANVAEVVRLTELFRELAAHPQRDESLVAWELGVKLRSRLREVSAIVERRGGESNRRAADATVATRVGGAPDQVGRAMLAPGSRVIAQQLPAPRAPGRQVVAPGVAVPVAQPAAQIVDYGPQLVELIQTTISPGTWNINGGPGAVVYYQPLRVLVVSAPDDVQNQIGGVVGQRRRP